MRYLLVLLFVLPGLGIAQPFPNAHSHNDYEHNRPLWDALSYGFGEVEADVHLINGKLLVAHTRPLFGGKTLEELYLKPIDSLLKTQNGRIFPGSDSPFYLMIDIKSDGPNTYWAIRKLILQYPRLLEKTDGFKHLIIFLSGERPMHEVLYDNDKLLALDGRPDDLGNSISTELMPVISDNFNQWSKWNGKGKPELEKVKQLAARVHAEGKKLRLWAIPDFPEAWDALRAAGVDIINSDHLPELSSYMKSDKK